MPSEPLLWAVVGIALVFDFINGFHDSANAIATVVSTRVLSPRQAVLMAGVLNLIGAVALGTGVALTVGGGIVDQSVVLGDQWLVMTALFGAIAWNLLTWYVGLPSSSSHALIGGLIGATVAAGHAPALQMQGILMKVIVPLVLSPIAGIVLGFAMMVGLLWIVHRMSPDPVNRSFRKLQLVSAAFMSLSHGTNDAQKSMGIITLAMIVGGHLAKGSAPPFWVIVACGVAMALGTAMGGWRIVRTLGSKIIKLDPIHGFAAETTASLVILTATLFHAPVSTTHVISGSILGAGSSQRLNAVRWGVAGNMLSAWVLTIPASALVAWVLYFGIKLVVH